MIQKATVSAAQRAVQMSRRHLMPNSSSQQPRRRVVDGHELRTITSLPLHHFYPNNHHIAHINRNDDDDNSLPRPISLLNKPQSTHYRQYNFMTTRQYHTTIRTERGAAIVLTLGAVAATAKAGQYLVEGYKEWKEASEAATKEEEKRKAELKAQGIDVDEEKKQEEEAKTKAQTEEAKQSRGGPDSKKAEGKRENFFAKFFNLSVGSKFYEGGFEEQMTRKEAALILGVRESSTPKRIKEAHRKLLILNHPDTGGSTYMAGKINEAKELLLQGKKM